MEHPNKKGLVMDAKKLRQAYLSKYEQAIGTEQAWDRGDRAMARGLACAGPLFIIAVMLVMHKWCFKKKSPLTLDKQ